MDMTDSLTFDNINSTSLNQENIGGPPIPMYQGCTPSITQTFTTQVNTNLTNEQKHAAYLAYINNNGYVPFDLTEVTTATSNTVANTVNNTAFFVFFTLFLLFIIIILILIVYEHLDVIIGLHVILLFSIIIYVMSVIYRQTTLNNITASQNSLNSAILENQVAFENSIIQLPNNIMTISNMLNNSIPTNTTNQSIHITPVNDRCKPHKHHHSHDSISFTYCSASDYTKTDSNPFSYKSKVTDVTDDCTSDCSSNCSCSSDSESYSDSDSQSDYLNSDLIFKSSL